MPLDRLRLVQLLQMLFLLIRQHLAPRHNGLLQSRNAAEADDGASHPLVDPRQGDMGDL